MLRTKWVSRAAAALAMLLVAAGTAAARPLSVEIWTDRGDDAVYRPGDVMQVKARTNDDAFLLVYEIDSEGAISVLFPFRRGAGIAEGGHTYRLPPESSGLELAVESATGQGYIVAIASREGFRELPWYLRPFDPQGESIGYEDRHDETEGFDEEGRVLGDPTVAIERIRRAVLNRPGATADFATSYATYFVGHEVRYPRYVCYDCHRPNHWAWWDGFDPYYTSCSVVDFRVNWNWCWGPCMWSGHVPYYYYVPRYDCPPQYVQYYASHERWSSWDGRSQWNDLFGGPLKRYKTPPPAGYQPPQSPGWSDPRNKPPGYISTSFDKVGRGRESVPIGRNRPDWSAKPSPQKGETGRAPAGSTPGKPDRYGEGKGGDKPSDRPGTKEKPRYEPRRHETPGEQPSAQPKQEQPKQQQPKQEQPKQEQPKQDQPKQEPPKQAPPQRDPPRQDPPRHNNNFSNGHMQKGGAGR